MGSLGSPRGEVGLHSLGEMSPVCVGPRACAGAVCGDEDWGRSVSSGRVCLPWRREL